MDNEWRDESAYGLIEGKSELRLRLSEITIDKMIIVLLCEPILWKQIAQGRRDKLPNFKEDRSYIAVQIKLHFLQRSGTTTLPIMKIMKFVRLSRICSAHHQFPTQYLINGGR
jgi:hypothetical protein